MLRPDTLALTALLAFLTSFGPLSVDLYLPSMPAIAAALAAPPAHVQLTISLYLVGFAIGQVVHGPISDRIGRKPIIVLSFVLYCVATLICLVSTSITVLIAGRFLQALGVSGSIVAVRAVVRDLYEGVRAGRQLSSMGVLMGFAPIIAPLTGGVLQTAFGWRAGFVFLIAVGALAGYLAWRFLPETHHARSAPSLAGLLSNYRRVATHRVFLANLLVGAVAYGGLFAWIAGSPFVLQFVFGFSPLAYAIAYAGSCLGFVAGATLATRLGHASWARPHGRAGGGIVRDRGRGDGARRNRLVLRSAADSGCGVLSSRAGPDAIAVGRRRADAISRRRRNCVGTNRLCAAMRRRDRRHRGRSAGRRQHLADGARCRDHWRRHAGPMGCHPTGANREELFLT